MSCTKCKKCNKKAVTYLKAYRIALCESCYSEFYLKLVKRCIKKYGIFRKNEKIVAAVSGGKDSSAMAVALKKIGYDADLIYVDLGIGSYSKKSEKCVEELSELIDSNLNIIRLSDYGFKIDQIKGKTCSACGVSKRYLMNKFAREQGYDVIATGHTAEDIVSFYIKNLAGGSKVWAEKLLPRNEPFDPKVVARAKPLYEISEKENMLFVLCNTIPFNPDDCPYAPKPEWKEIVYEIERKKPGFTKNFVRGLVREGKFPETRYCKICGEVSSSEVCSFCKLRRRFGCV
mgnify:CR=1 FL=1